MRVFLLTSFFLLMTVFTTFANNEKISVILPNGPGGDYVEDNPTNVPFQNPCQHMTFKVESIIPSGYANVKRYDWYVNGAFLKSTTNVQFDINNNPWTTTDVVASTATTTVVCKIFYVKNDPGQTVSAAFPTGGFGIKLKSLSFGQIIGPNSVPLLPQNVSYNIVNTGTNSSTIYSPASTEYAITWQAPAGWTQTANTNGGKNVSYTTDTYTGGTLTSAIAFTACTYQDTRTMNIVRPHGTPAFAIATPTRLCGTFDGTNPITATYSISPMVGVSNYTYEVTANDLTHPLDNVTIAGSGGQTSFTTTSTSVTLDIASSQNQVIYLEVTAHFGDNTTSFAGLIVDYTTMEWGAALTYECWPANVSPSDNFMYQVTAPYIAGAYYYWYEDNFMVDQGYGNVAYLTWHGESTIQVRATTDCGQTSLYSEYINPPSCFGFRAAPENLSLYPNPASGQVTISMKDVNRNVKVPENAMKDIREITVLDKLGNIKKITKYAPGSRSVTLNLNGMASDLYILQVSDGVHKTNIQLSKVN
jgi:hypothetical protein